MIGGKLPNTAFQTFYTSREESNCPLLPEFVKFGKKVKDSGLSKNITSAVISVRYGKRMIINTDYSNIDKITRGEILEIVDYDPVKKVLLTMGPKQPKIETPVHWMVHHARNEVNAVVQLTGENIIRIAEGKIPSTDNEHPVGSFEMIKEVLKELGNSKSVLIKNHGVLFVGQNLNELEDEVFKKLIEPEKSK